MMISTLPLIVLASSLLYWSCGNAEQNKRLLELFYQEIYQDWQLDRLDKYLSPDFLSHDWPSGVTGPRGFKAYYETFRTALPDARYTVEDLIAEGDRVVVRWRMDGTYQEKFPGIDVQPTGQSARLRGVAIYRLEDGVLAERWVVSDLHGLLQEVKASSQ